MLSRRTKKSWQPLLWRSLLIIVLTLMTFAVVFITSNPTPLAKDATVITVIEKPKATVGLPIRLKIPVINVDATITYVGLTPDGAMDIDKDPDAVAWYNLGPRPGEEGSSVIAGHYGWTGEKASVFNGLNTLNKDDEVSVIDEKGVTTTFIVRESRKYDPEADATSVFKSDDGKAHLNLITCDGVWKNVQQTYSDRLVVFTDKK